MSTPVTITDAGGTWNGAPAVTTDNDPLGIRGAKPTDKNLDFVTLETNFVGAPAPRNLQIPPRTQGRPI
jgi:hypothetical protein